MRQNPKALIFDLGGVIVPLDFKRAYRQLESMCGLPAADIPKRIGATGLVPVFETGGIEAEPFAERILESLGLRKSYPEFCEMFSQIFLPGPLLPERLFRALRERYRLVLLSNTNVIHYPRLHAEYPLLELFHERVLSYEVGALKPSPAIYREAVKRAACAAEECFFTDDVLPYVEAARNEGIDAVQFESAEQLERELRARGVEWESSL